MRRRVLVVDVVAVHGDRVARLPQAHRRSDTQHHPGGVAADDVIRLIVTRAPHALFAETRQEREGGHRLEDRRPHGVEVDRRRHHRDERLVGRELGHRHLVDVDRLAWVLVVGGNPREHLGLVGPHDGGTERLGNFEGGELVGGSPVDDRGTDGINLGHGSGK